MQALILSPTRELAAQTTKTILAVGDFAKISAHTCIGGTSLGAHAPSPSCNTGDRLGALEAVLACHIRGLAVQSHHLTCSSSKPALQNPHVCAWGRYGQGGQWTAQSVEDTGAHA